MNQEIFNYLMSKKVPMVKKTNYSENGEKKVEWSVIKLVKKGYYWYANGKRISKNYAFYMANRGVAEC